MPRSTKRAAAGCGTIRKRTRIINGKEYTSWEGRYTIGIDPSTGKQKQKPYVERPKRKLPQKSKQRLLLLIMEHTLNPLKQQLVSGWISGKQSIL